MYCIKNYHKIVPLSPFCQILELGFLEVPISTASLIPGNDSQQACTTALVPFEKIIPLPVYGLSAGNYEYTVNKKVTGSFELKSDNNLPD